MRKPELAGGLLAVLVLAVMGCESPTETGASPAEISLVVVSGSGQTGPVGAELREPLVVRVTKDRGVATVGVPLQLVNFRVLTGGGSVFAGSALTDLHGYAREYWTLGPNPGQNILEVRSVDPSTGVKQVHARFEATGVAPAAEVCNGIDDNFDGTVDDGSWSYCIAGTPAPNTNGKNSCSLGFLDANGAAADGCEARVVDGLYRLSPALSTTCDVPFGLPNTVTLSHVTITTIAPNLLRITGTAGWFELPTIEASVDPVTQAFGGSRDFTAGVLTFSTTGTVTVNLRFTLPGTFEGSIDVVTADQACTEIHETVVGTRQGS